MLREILGEPRGSYSQDCQPVTNPRMLKLLETRKIGGFTHHDDSPGARIRCRPSWIGSSRKNRKYTPPSAPPVRSARASSAARPSSVSSHAWAAAVDLTLKKNLDRMGDGTTQFGLVILAEAFNDAGWYWGAGYGREDSMHFEVGEDLLRKWVAEGKL